VVAIGDRGPLAKRAYSGLVAWLMPGKYAKTIHIAHEHRACNKLFLPTLVRMQVCRGQIAKDLGVTELITLQTQSFGNVHSLLPATLNHGDARKLHVIRKDCQAGLGAG